MSRSNPQFNKDPLADALAASQIGDEHLAALGGTCRKRMDQTGVEAVAPPAMRQSATEGMDSHRRTAELRLERPVVGLLATNDWVFRATNQHQRVRTSHLSAKVLTCRSLTSV